MGENRFGGLDYLRFVAAVGVMVTHFGESLLPAHAFAFSLLGRLSVNLFFIISGVVILRSAEAAPSRGYFLRRRALRLFPAYLICLAVAFAVYTPLHGTIPVADTLAHLTMLQRLFGTTMIYGLYWTLSHEWTFYLMVALALPLLRAHALALATAWVAATIALRALGVADPTLGVILNVDCAYLFATGMLIHEIQARRASNRGVLALAALLFVAAAGGPWGGALWPGLVPASIYLLMYLLCVGLTLAGIGVRLPARLQALAVVAGAVSYPLYLIHPAVSEVMAAVTGGWATRGAGWVLLSVTASVGASFLIARYLEWPARRLLASAFQQLAAIGSRPARDRV